MNLDATPPPSFLSSDGRRIVFVKFIWARHSIEIDVGAQTVAANSSICFDQMFEGHPVVDLGAGDGSILSAAVDGKKVGWGEVLSPYSDRFPDGGLPVTSYRVLDRSLPPGRHVFSSRNLVEGGFRFPTGAQVEGYFEMSDDESRSGSGGRPFLERYLPANLEFDRHPSIWHVSIVGTSKPHSLFSNGSFHGDDGFRWTIAFPSYFTSSSPFLLILPRSEAMTRTFFAHTPKDTSIRVDVVSSHSSSGDAIDDFKDPVRGILVDLHSHFGPFPFERLLICSAAGSLRPMEYSAAVVSSLSTLGHELSHCYFGRSVSPVDGDAGWIDEGIAAWYSEGVGPIAGPLPMPKDTYIGAMSPYRRFTDPQAWKGGLPKGVIALLDFLLSDKGGMSRFLTTLMAADPHASLTSHGFQQRIEQFAQRSFAEEVFDRYVFVHSS